MRLRTKIIIPKIIIILVLMAAFAYFLIYLVKNDGTIKENQAEAQHIVIYSNTLASLHGEVQNNLLTYSLTADNNALEQIRININQINSIVSTENDRVKDSDEKEFLYKYQDSLAGFEDVLNQLTDAINVGDRTALAAAFNKWNTKSQFILATLADLNTFSFRTHEQSTQLFQNIITKAKEIAWVILIISVSLTVINYLFLHLWVTLPLSALASTADHISRGNFEMAVPKIKSKDEMGQLSRSINNMSLKLKSLYQNLEHEVFIKTNELSKQNKELERSNKELEDFAYVASHDLQEPLRKIQAFGNLLHDEYGPALSDDAKDYIKRMRNASSRMSTLISDLLIFSRVTTKARPFEKVDLSIIVNDVLSDMEMRIKDTRAVIEVEPLPVIDADPLLMSQMAQNLISNALKFHKKDEVPHLRIYCRESILADGAGHSIFFEDKGIGIDEKYSDKIFMIFQRLHTQEEYKGTGIGLAVVKKIVDRHHGTIKISSNKGSGATFIVTLPLHQLLNNNN